MIFTLSIISIVVCFIILLFYFKFQNKEPIKEREKHFIPPSKRATSCLVYLIVASILLALFLWLLYLRVI